MSLAFSWKKTFDRACNAFFPMVMATEPGKQNDAREGSSLSVPNKINSKCVGNSLSQLPAERNGVISRQKQAGSLEKHDELSTPKLDLVSPNGELGAAVDTKLSNNDGSNNNLKSDVSSSHLRQLLLLHLDLIQQQQQQIQEKDKEIVQLKTEKEQLEARLQRMERRMAAKRHNDDYNEEGKKTIGSITPGPAKAKTIIQTRKISISEYMRRKAIPAAAPVVMSSQIESVVSVESCLRTETLFLDDETNILNKITPEKNIAEQQQQQQQQSSSAVQIPQFRIIENFASLIKTTGTTTRSSVGTVIAEPSENLDDDTFSKRHQRYEADEKKRKKWDIQRYRALKQREEHKQREEARLKGTRKVIELEEKLIADDSFVPNCFEICEVEMSDTVPVSAFGAPVQSFSSSEFDLPWFSLDRRELQEREKLKSKGRGRRKSSRKTIS